MLRFVLTGLALTFSAMPATAQIVVSANDGSAVLVDGVNVVPSPPGRDTVTILDASQTVPRIIAEIEAPSSVIGPPNSVAISPDNRLAVVASSMKVDPADPTKTVPDNTLTVIDISSETPAVVGTATAGAMASGLSFSPDGRLLLVANRGDGTVSVFRVDGQTLSAAGTIDFEAPASGPSHVVVTPDGRRALVTRDGDSLVSVLRIDGQNVTYTGQTIAAGLKPYGMEITPDGRYALIANVVSTQWPPSTWRSIRRERSTTRRSA
jgi:DNA-binding beta-propeller fold protein YncE